MNNIRRLAFIGGGNMAAALIGGLTKRGLPAARVVVADPSQDQLKRLVRDFGVTTAADNATAVKGAEVVVLAVKPQQMRAVALGLAPHLTGIAAFGDFGGGRHTACGARALVRPRGSGHTHHAESAGPERLRRHRLVCARQRRRRQSGVGGDHHGRRQRHGVGGTRVADGYRHRACPAAARPIFSCSWRRSKRRPMSVGCRMRLPIN